MAPNSAQLPPFEQRLLAAWDKLRDNCGLPSGAKVLVAVSGGADSVALLLGLARLRNSQLLPAELVVGHFDHGVRASSAADAAWVAELSRRLNISCEVGHAVSESPPQDEQNLRLARYEFFLECAERLGANCVAMAHTADDQAETILHRLIRGTGPEGLRGMPEYRPLAAGVWVVRPLLELSRADVLSYLDEHGETFREDPSNADLGYLRNRIRHELLPLLAEHYNPGVRDALLRLGRLSGEMSDALAADLPNLERQSIVSRTADEVCIRCQALADAAPYLARQFFIHLWQTQAWPRQQMGLNQWERLAGMVEDAAAAAIVLPGNIHCRRSAGLLWLIAKS